MPYAMLIDVTRCVGCGQCRDACQAENKQPTSDAETLNFERFSVVQTRSFDGAEVEGRKIEGGERYVRRMCMHCKEPACASVCPVGALHKTSDGPVLYDPDKCMGCRYCMVACPFGVPTYEWSSRTPRIRKCFFCTSRIAKGQKTACAEACPVEATSFGTREEMLAEAHRRIEESPDTYVHTVYGEHEAGGTSVLYLSDIPFEKLGLPVGVPEEPLPGLTFRVLEKIPSVSTLWGTMLAGTWWVVHRRMTLAENAADAHGSARSTEREEGRTGR
ncbi:MAG: 4Fe-4S dicluster domain-containing protein [Candidatus Eisenbacteria bacterium]